MHIGLVFSIVGAVIIALVVREGFRMLQEVLDLIADLDARVTAVINQPPGGLTAAEVIQVKDAITTVANKLPPV